MGHDGRKAPQCQSDYAEENRGRQPQTDGKRLANTDDDQQYGNDNQHEGNVEHGGRESLKPRKPSASSAVLGPHLKLGRPDGTPKPSVLPGFAFSSAGSAASICFDRERARRSYLLGRGRAARLSDARGCGSQPFFAEEEQNRRGDEDRRGSTDDYPKYDRQTKTPHHERERQDREDYRERCGDRAAEG